MSGISGFQPGASVYAQAWGIKNGVGEAPHIDVRDPATSDVQFDLGKNWVNEAGNKVWVLTSLSTFNGAITANWIETSNGSGTGIIETIDGDSGSITGATVTVYANNAANISGASVQFVNSGTISTLNVTDGSDNTLIGRASGNLTVSGANNVGVGSFSLQLLSSGQNNCALGYGALGAASTGSNNIGIGFGAGDVFGTESSSIYINSLGIAGLSNTLFLGNATGTGAQQLNAAYIHGIYSNTQPVSGTVEYVTINNATGLMGVTATAAGSVILTGDTGTAITGNSLTVYANQAARTCGSSVFFDNDGATTSLLNVTDGNGNTVIGQNSGLVGFAGTDNAIYGAFSLQSATGATANAGVGGFIFQSLTSGSHNCALGGYVLQNLVTGDYNTAIGRTAGSSYSSSESDNLLLHSSGVAADSNVLRIGDDTGTGSGVNEFNSAYIQGIYSNTQNPSGTVEYVTINNTSGLLGVTTLGSGLIPYTDEAVSFLAVVNNGYFCTAALTVTLPAAPAQGEVITLGIETAGAVVIQAVGAQIIRLGSTASSAAGTATSTAIGSSIELVYRAASTTWFSISTEGSWTLA